ncbi:hypothetical protein MKK63_03765 [Methylobacterium sp. J-088]|uniref:hypothetical protein n=1 Tax=unclassified Methylobacterium TaxID=2615210 RepID=UPI001FB86AC7|nr:MULTISPECIES: hypothetical protein [unclassified Methylobacterium]MCJ2061818.1 hypothetical protein [Methylobacterium sp. J-088]
MVRAGSDRESPGAKPFEPIFRPERLIEGGDTGRRDLDEPYAASGTVRSAPGRSEREGRRIVGFCWDGKPEWFANRAGARRNIRYAGLPERQHASISRPEARRITPILGRTSG